MSRIEYTFKTLNRPALIAFITAGDPDYNASMAVLKSLPNAGADIIELGMPFTDPMSDGETIQHASQRALKNGANMEKTLQMVREFRVENDTTPIVLMGYANPVFIYGYDQFAKDAAEAGVDGFIIVDLPPEESTNFQDAIKPYELDLIRLITPTTHEERLKTILNGASGFLYYVSITGVTGAAQADLNAIVPHIENIKSQTHLPIAIGFGIKTAEDVSQFSSVSDAVVVGSAIVKNMANSHTAESLSQVIEKQVKQLASGLK